VTKLLSHRVETSSSSSMDWTPHQGKGSLRFRSTVQKVLHMG
jgi:hypothetical protein